MRELHGDDRQRMSKEMMDLYKREKINPLGGCLPILVQMPVFIALYWVLLESVELRQAPFILWINDLSVKDPYFHFAAAHGRFDVHPNIVKSDTTGPYASKNNEVYARCLYLLFLMVPSRIGSILGHQ